MDPKIKQLKSTTFNGRRFTRRQLSDMQRTMANFPKLSRKELAQTICENLKWRTPGGGNSYQTCLGVLFQLEQLGVLQLPPKFQSQWRGAEPAFRRAAAQTDPVAGRYRQRHARQRWQRALSETPEPLL